VRPLIPNATRTVRLIHAFDLATSTIPDLKDGESVELDATHAGDTYVCVVSRVADGFDVRGVRLHVKGVSNRTARQGFSGLWLAVEDEAPGVTHATVRRYGRER
jgi:hypothetical protein